MNCSNVTDVVRRRILLAGPALALGGLGGMARAQAFPSRPIRWVVGYAAGGGSDFAARTIAQAWQEQITQPIVIENKPGANTALAASDVARARADGYTIGFVGNGTMALNPLLYKKLPYDPQKDFRGVTMIGRMPSLLAVHADLGITSVQQYVQRAKEKPGGLVYSSPGAGNAAHLAMEMFNSLAGISTVHAPYKGAAPALADVAAGHVQATMVDLAAGSAFFKSGRIRPLAVANATRLSGLPATPTFAEAGFPGFESAALQGIVVPAATPPEIVALLNQQLVTAIRSRGVHDKLLDYGIEPSPGTPKDFDETMMADRRRWEKVVTALNLTLD